MKYFSKNRPIIAKIVLDDYIFSKIPLKKRRKLPLIELKSKIMRKKGYMRRVMLLADGLAGLGVDVSRMRPEAAL